LGAAARRAPRRRAAGRVAPAARPGARPAGAPAGRAGARPRDGGRVAYPRLLRRRAGALGHARRRAPQLPRQRPALLVAARRSGRGAAPPARRPRHPLPADHLRRGDNPRHLAHLRGRAGLRDLPGGPAHLGHLGARRSAARQADHVGGRGRLLSAAAAPAPPSPADGRRPRPGAAQARDDRAAGVRV
ncbi:MAG: hypothetical protein AVDCRST_MAG40-2069, partial [uncultured Gemmatimonadaceae bacterium]